jgi:hypothetical protein
MELTVLINFAVVNPEDTIMLCASQSQRPTRLETPATEIITRLMAPS